MLILLFVSDKIVKKCNFDVAKCIDKYISLKTSQFEDPTSIKIDPRLEDVVQRMFLRCFENGDYQQVGFYL